MAVKIRTGQFDWEDLRVLIELARHGSLSATAREMGITHATVGRRIGNLERDLGLPLFVRESGRYILTDAGMRVLQMAEPMAAGADAVRRTATSYGAKLVGPVRITATEAVATYILIPGLVEIRARYPDLDLVLNVTQANLNLARSDADIALRLAEPEPETGLVGIPVAPLEYHLYGNRSYVEGRKSDDFEYIGYPQADVEWLEHRVFREVARGRRISLRTNHLGNRITAIRYGLGVGLIPRIMAEAWPELIRISGDKPVMQRSVFLIMHESVQGVVRVKACKDVLVEVLERLIVLRA